MGIGESVTEGAMKRRQLGPTTGGGQFATGKCGESPFAKNGVKTCPGREEHKQARVSKRRHER